MSATPENRDIVRAISLELRHELEGSRDAGGRFSPGDLERRLASLGVRRDRPAVDVAALPQLSREDRAARKVVDAFLASRAEAGVDRTAAFSELVRDAAYSWANRLLALRCMEARSIIDEVILQKEAYGGRSLRHHRLAQRAPERCAGPDDGLFAVLFDEFAERARTLPLVFDPTAPEVAFRPSVASLKRCIAILSGTEAVRGYARATDEVFSAPDCLGWAYESWNAEEKDRVFGALVSTRGAKVEGPDLIPATCIYTPSYMVELLVQNSLGALWLGMHPGSALRREWTYYVDAAEPVPPQAKRARDITFLDPACGSGHFLLIAFDLLYAMYAEEGEIEAPADICASIFENNLHGIDIDERAVQIAALALVMRAKEKAADFEPRTINLVSTNIHLPAPKAHLVAFLRKHPEDAPLGPALLAVFEALAHADELGSLVRIEEPLDLALDTLRGQDPLFGPRLEEDRATWKHEVILRLRQHLHEEESAPDLATSFFGQEAQKGLSLVDLLTRRYDVVGMNPPYLGFRKLAPHLKDLIAADEDAKLDIFVAFLSRFFSILDEGGSLAAVSPSSWTTSSRTTRLRQRMLDEGGPRIVAGLGQYVFRAAPLLFVSLQVITRDRTHRPTSTVTIRPTQPGAEALREALRTGARRWPLSVIRELETLPFLPVAPLELLERAKSQPKVAHFFSFVDGAWTGSNDRDVRETWEVAPGREDWIPVSGGQGYARWYAPLSRRIRASEIEGWTAAGARSFALEYARVAGGKLAARVVRTPSAAVAGIVSILPIEDTDPRRLFETATVFNSRLGTVWLRTLTSGLNFNPGYAGGIPLAAEPPPAALESLVNAVVGLKRQQAAGDIACDDFTPALFESGPGSAPLERAESFMARSVEAVLTALDTENSIEGMLKEHFAISSQAWREIAAELGSSAAALPREPARAEGVTPETTGAGEDEEADEVRGLPAESDLERLAREHGIHPRSLVERTDLPPTLSAAIATLRNDLRLGFAQDYVCLVALRLFGHRWPSERHATHPAVTGAIVPLTGAGDDPSLVDRVRQRLRADFPETGDDGAERELAAILGKPLERWIETDLARYHASRFGKRPVLWQIQSGRYTAARRPAFAALIYYHRLDGDTLPALRFQYIGPLRTRLETEQRGIEAIRAPDRTRHQASRLAEIEAAQEELHAFDARLEGVIAKGFASAALDALVAREPLDALSSRDGRSPPPATREAFAADESQYDPDPDDGVRVNVAPLQRAGLLAADVISAKDVDRAIADRAEWRGRTRARGRERGVETLPWWRRGSIC